MLFKNSAQKIHVYAYDSTTGAAKTGDAANITAYVSLDGTANAIDDTNPAEVDSTNMPGVYVFDLTAAETNCDSFALYAKSSTSNIRLEPIIGFTTAGAVPAAVAGAASGLSIVGSAMTLAADQAVNVTKWGGTAVASAYVQANAAQFAGQTITCAGGVTIPAATLASTTNITAATGVTLTATTGLGNQTANITGNLSGSVDSVTGAVGSVTGNVGGNVTGSVGSVAAGGIAAASFAAGAIDAEAIANGAIDNATFAADVGSTAYATNVIALAADKAIQNAALATAAELAKVPKSDSNVTWNATALASINAEVDTALNTAIPGSPTADSINERIATMDGHVTNLASVIEVIP